MKNFHLIRLEDVTGISGTGLVAEGVVFSNGKTVVTWITHTCSIVIYDNVDDVLKIHGHGGKTVMRWLHEDKYFDYY